jgi:outer membrane protein OmpA-like peptidoglycan-associated protein/tetratricopeptide (TPR) repeat protein
MKSIRLKITIPVLFLLAMIVLPATTSAQLFNEKKADSYFEEFAYSKAAEIYEVLHRDNPGNAKFIQQLAYSYYKMADYPRALNYYALLVQLDEHQPKDYYDYAQLLRIAGRIEESKTWLEKYIVVLPGDQRAIKQLESINQLIKLKTNIQSISTKNLDGNSRFTDMCPMFYKDCVVYSSAKDSFSMVRNKFEWNDQPFLDLYVSKPGKEQVLKTDDKFSSELNSRLHEGPVCFTSDFGTIYFTRNNFLNGKISRTAEGVNNLKIFIADQVGNEWKNIRELPFNSDAYSVGHPALSPDNKTLYFVSDMPGGLGETDIYKSEWIGGKWGKPLNLGGSINTRGKEMFPYVDKLGILYFASNGQPGIGGLDVFAAKQEENGDYLVVNLGSPLNSQQDDFGFVLNTDSLSGYYTSNRPGGKGGDDNYSFKVDKIDLNVIAYDLHSKEILPGTKIVLMGDDGKVLDTKTADNDGATDFSVIPGTNYQLLAEDKTHVAETKPIVIQSTLFDFRQHEDVFLKRTEPYLTIEVIDKESGLIIPNAIVDISEGKYNQDELEDSNGVIRLKLFPSMNYTFYATSEEYFDNTVTFSSVDKAPGEYSITIELEKIAAGKQFTLDDLYYDLNKYNIRPDAAIVLDKLVKILVDNPEVRIEIGSHTDSRGTAESNMILSQRRSESVMAYLESKGIAHSRLVAKGFGESQLINKCADGVDCPEIDHQANRRTVIEILNPNIRKVKRGAKNIYYF